MNMSNDWKMDAHEEFNAVVACFKKEWPNSLGFFALNDEDAKYIIIFDVYNGDGIIYNREDGTYKRLEMIGHKFFI